MVRMEYQVKLQYEAIGSSDFLINIRPAKTHAQRILQESFSVEGATHQSSFVDLQSANRMDRVHAQGGMLSICHHGIVEINHGLHEPSLLQERLVSTLPPYVLSYTLPSRYCPSDKLRRNAMRLFGDLLPGYSRVAAIAKWVNEHVKFRSGASDAMTCAIDTYNAREGVCRDYAHLMISMCRALNIPARYVTGVDYGADPALGPTDFHAYVEAFLGQHWYLFDPSGVSPVMGLIRIGTGRDAGEVPFSTLFGNVRYQPPEVNITMLDVSSLLANTGQQLTLLDSENRAVTTAHEAMHDDAIYTELRERTFSIDDLSYAHIRNRLSLTASASGAFLN